ncbi:YjiH family protein [Alkalihalobacillus trypoxylicola]|uniref:Nucleoside transporter/FeoB GTPase Gate domain-containing protein n=1 Tax=Alkalihalobacillus trypoxylicola TaxID=519424 RepID=A0A161PBW0_9BACI|nr:YjiH family protein [Alkalihalobacillus trypoxylicola]KYG29299.1 hypothetical protein AZF04_07170 [Alkalihalobacillus trypoxylicola]
MNADGNKIHDKKQRKTIIGFILPSIIGVFLFMTPVYMNGQFTIPIAYLAGQLQQLLNTNLPYIVFYLLLGGFVISCFLTFLKKDLSKYPKLLKVFVVSPWSLLVRFLSLMIVGATLWQWGPEIIWSEDTGGTLIYELVPILVTVFLFAGLFLPLLMDFGLLEFIGSRMNQIMRPVFKLPGRSAIDCLASWVGDGTVGVLLTNKQYEEGYYTKREAIVIGTTFSVVSITFSIVILEYMNLGEMFFPYYLSILISGFIAAVIMPRIPPLSRKEDRFINNEQFNREKEETREVRWRDGYLLALERVRNGDGFTGFLTNGIKNVLDMWLAIIPIVIVIGTFSLIIATYTPLFQIVGKPFEYILTFLQVPEAGAAAQTMVVGFADMFLPAILGASIESEMTRFIIAAVSVTQLIYMSEIGGLLLGSKIPVTFLDLIVIFFQRTLITLPIIVLIAWIVF